MRWRFWRRKRTQAEDAGSVSSSPASSEPSARTGFDEVPGGLILGGEDERLEQERLAEELGLHPDRVVIDDSWETRMLERATTTPPAKFLKELERERAKADESERRRRRNE